MLLFQDQDDPELVVPSLHGELWREMVASSFMLLRHIAITALSIPWSHYLNAQEWRRIVKNGVQEQSGRTCIQMSMMGKFGDSLATGKVISLSLICLDHLT